MDHDEKQKESDEDLLKRRFLKESPFNTINGNFRYTACVGTNGGYDQSTIYNGFKDAVDTLIESIGDNRTQADAMVYPILYCIRHCIELFLKSSYQSIQYINCLKCNHDSYNKLKKLWKISLKTSRQQEDCEWLIKNSDEEVDATRLEKAQSRYETLKNRFDRISECINSCSKECFQTMQDGKFTHDLNELIQDITEIYQVDSRISELFDNVLPLLDYYKDIDPQGDAFRYWSDKDGNPHFKSKNIGIVKLDIVAVQFQEISEQFSQIEYLLWYLKKEYNTGTFTKDLSREQIEEIAKVLPAPNEFNERIKEVKEQVKKRYNIGSNKFKDVLKIIRRHREFISYMGSEIKFSHLSDNAMRIFAECAIGKQNWEEASRKISLSEMQLLVTFSDISGWRYQEKCCTYFSEDLSFVLSETKRNRISCYDINPISEAKYVIAGMKKCGQMTYASTIENYISQLNAQQSSLSEVKSD